MDEMRKLSVQESPMHSILIDTDGPAAPLEGYG